MTSTESQDAFRSYFGSLHLLYVIEDGLTSALSNNITGVLSRSVTQKELAGKLKESLFDIG